MADLMVGNREGVAASGSQPTLLATITADNATDNVVDVDSADNLRVGMTIDIVTIADGTEVATDRTITSIVDNAGTIEVTYSGADVDAAADDGIYPANGYTATGRSNVNGGLGPRQGLSLPGTDDIQAMRDWLSDHDSSEYTTARLNNMTMNDMLYAIRVAYAPDSIKDE